MYIIMTDNQETLSATLIEENEEVMTETEEQNDNDFVFNWKLEPELFKTSIFDKKKMREHPDIKMVYGFIKSNMGINYGGISRYSHIPYATELDQINKYKECFNQKSKCFIIPYQLSKHKWGRVNPVGYSSLSIFHRPTRHSFCKDRYIDIDMTNAQPTILLEVCNHHNLKKDALNKYVDNPTYYRGKIMDHHKCDKDTAKRLPITLMMGGTYDGWLRENTINITTKLKMFYDLELELKDIIEIIYANNKDTITKDVLRQDKKKWKNINEEKRGTMGLWGQSVERLMQETSIKWLVDNMNFEIEDIVPCQDGFMILEELYYDTILEDISKVILDKWNIDIEYKVKPFDEAIEIHLEDGAKGYMEWTDLISEKKLADRFYEEYGHFTARNAEQLYIYYEKDGIGRWYDETNKEKRYKLTLYISEHLHSLLYAELSAEIGLEEHIKNGLITRLREKTSNRINKIIEHILPKVKETDKFNANPLLLGFTNGVIELPTNTFRPYKYDDYMTINTGYDYYEPTNPNIDLHNELCDILESIQPDKEQLDLLLQMLASGLDGNLYQKLFLLNGKGGNGKGLLGKLMRYVLGEYYYQPPNTIIKDFEKGQTASPELYNCKGKRYINFTEVDGRVRVAMLRNLTGGGLFTARLLRENPETFNLTATINMEFNNAPDLDGKPMDSDYRRLIHIDFPINFTDDINKIDKVINGTLFKKANSYYETEEFILNMRPTFLNLLLNVYQTKYNQDTKSITLEIPQQVRKRTEKFIEDQNKFQKVFNDMFVRSDIILDPNGKPNKEDKKKKTLLIKDFWKVFQFSDEYKDLKTTRQRQEYGRDECYKWLRNTFVVNPNVKTGEFILGVMLKEDNEDTNEIISDEDIEEEP